MLVSINHPWYICSKIARGHDAMKLVDLRTCQDG